jgi:hypothetical protein
LPKLDYNKIKMPKSDYHNMNSLNRVEQSKPAVALIGETVHKISIPYGSVALTGERSGRAVQSVSERAVGSGFN